MRKVVHKVFFIWSFDKEEEWLNEMAAQGFALVSVGFVRYEFELCNPGEYNIRLEMLNNSVSHPESQSYIRFLEDTGVEHIGTLFRWVYYRKRANGAPFDLFSDIDSRIRHLNRLLIIPAILGFMNLINAINTTQRCFLGGGDYMLWPAVLTWACSLLMVYGYIRLLGKKRKLKKERMLHE